RDPLAGHRRGRPGIRPILLSIPGPGRPHWRGDDAVPPRRPDATPEPPHLVRVLLLRRSATAPGGGRSSQRAEDLTRCSTSPSAIATMNRPHPGPDRRGSRPGGVIVG